LRHGACGACTVHIDGVATRSCITSVDSIGASAITTIEAVGATPVGAEIQKAWLDGEVPQCGYCQSGQIMSAAALLASEAEVVLHGFVACSDGRLYHPVICEIARKRYDQLQGRQRGAALSRRRQAAKRTARERSLAAKRIGVSRLETRHECYKRLFRQDDVSIDFRLRITPDAGRVKTGKARTVPIHPHLVKMGLLD
jgi:xanthine dehydrogenase iron-sulfur cluster and FAD-binding subunit A